MKTLINKFRLFNPQLTEEDKYVRYKYDFLNTVYFFICTISFIMSFIRLYENKALSVVTLIYSLSGFAILYYLHTDKKQIERACTLILIQSFIFSFIVYLLNFPYTLRLSLFFLLLSTALFLKGRKQGFKWMMVILVSIFIGDFFFLHKAGYSYLNTLVSFFSIMFLYFIINSFEKVKEEQTNDLKASELHLEQSIQKRTKELVHANTLLEIEKQALRTLSFTDQLTGLYNRYKVNEYFEYEKKQIKRYKTNMSIIIIDIDYFKIINDNFGHTVGDLILQELAALLKQSVRDTDIVSRWGGEEFVILVPQTNMQQAIILAEKIRQNIKNHQFSHENYLTVSFGIASFIEGDSLDHLIFRADKALYRAKSAGRDNIKTCACLE